MYETAEWNNHELFAPFLNFTVEPPNNGHNGTSELVLLMEVVLCSEVISSIKEFNVCSRSGTKLMVYLFTMRACVHDNVSMIM